ncbi:unnamed protein product [Chrysoparadoxa australica]
MFVVPACEPDTALSFREMMEQQYNAMQLQLVALLPTAL